MIELRQVKRILIFSPYALWTFHTTYERAVAMACQAQGASVEYLLCDGLLPECDLHWRSKGDGPRPADLCQRCLSKANASMASLEFPYRWLGDFVSPIERTEASAWANAVSPNDMRRASFQGLPVGEWVLSTMISYFRQYPPDTEDGDVVNAYRGFLISAALVAIGIRNYLGAHAIDSALIFNGRQSITRVAREIIQERGIRVLTHERAEYERGHLNVKPNADCMSLHPFGSLWSMWGEVPLDKSALNAALKWLIQRRYGANLAWIPFNTSFLRDSSLRQRLNLDRNKRLFALFTSSTDEVAGDPNRQGPYESQDTWVRDVVKWVEGRDDVELIIKVHPNIGGNDYIGKAVDELRIYQEMKLALPANVRIVLPEDLLNAYSLADEADVGLTFGSTIGLEMAMLGKPVVLASKAMYGYGSRITSLTSREELPEMLDNCMHASTSREIRREAFRLAYYYIFAFELPFPAVTMSGIHEARLNYVHRHDMSFGKDDSLDHICNYLIKDLPLFDAPTAEERSRTTLEEDTFFDHLESDGDSLRNVWHERRQRLQSLGRSIRDLIRHLPFGVGESVLDLGRSKWQAFLTWVETKA